MGYRVPIEEQETVIQISRGEKIAYIMTSDTTMIHKLDKLCAAAPETWHCKNVGIVDGELIDKTYTCPKRVISFRSRSKRMQDQENSPKNEL